MSKLSDTLLTPVVLAGFLFGLLFGPGCRDQVATPEAAKPPVLEAAPAAATPAAAPVAPAPPAPGPPATTVEAAVQPAAALGHSAEINSKVAAIDLDGDGRDEIAVASVHELAVLRPGPDGKASVVWRADAPGGATAIGSGDVDGDGRADLIVGWGAHREKRSAPASLRVYRTRGAPSGGLLEEPVSTPRTSRAQFESISVTSLASGGGRGILYTHYASKYQVRGAFSQLDSGEGWRERELYVIRMGAKLAAAPSAGRAGEARLIVGRPYGDGNRTAGDVFALGNGSARRLLPSLRGVRSLVAVRVGPADAPIDLICYGDGWHWRYRDEGRGRVTCASPQPDGGFSAQLVAVTDSYSVENLAPADLDGDGVVELVGQGADGLYRFTPRREAEGTIGWSAQKVGPGGYHFAVVDTNGDSRDELALAGETPSLLSLPVQP